MVRAEEEESGASGIYVPWMGWSLAESALDYLKPRAGADTDISDYPRPPGVPEEARLAIRRDYDCFTTRSTWAEGPPWCQVFRRITYDECGQAIFDDAVHESMSFDEIHKKFEPMQRVLETHLWYFPMPIEGALLRRPARVDKPTQSQVIEHEAQNHAVYRSWCEICVRARSTGTQHRKRSEEEKREDGPCVHSDFFFMQSAPFLALKSTPSGRLQAVALPDKSNSEYVQKAMVRFIRESGHKRLMHKSDNEPALLAIKASATARMPEVEVVDKSSPVGDHQANGAIEVAVRELKRQTRALRMSLEHKLGRSLDNGHPLVAWVSSFAAEAINVFRKDSSGKTPYEKEFGRRWTRASLEFGERVYIREAKEKDGRLDWEAMAVPVRFVGHHARTNAVMGLSEDGLKIGQAVKRLPEDKRWTLDGLDELRGYPWDVKSRSRVSEGSHVPRLPAPSRDVPRIPPPIDVLPSLGRAFYVMKTDVEKHGYTDGCKGCIAAKAGSVAVAHNAGCRSRIMELVDPGRLERHAKRVEVRKEARDAEMQKREAEKVEQAQEGPSHKRVRLEPPPSPRSPISPSKRWRREGHMQYKRVAETPIEEIDPAAVQVSEPEVVPSEAPPLAVGEADVTLEDVLGRGDAPISDAAATTAAPTPGEPPGQDPAGDVSFLDICDDEIVMSGSKWRCVEALDGLRRQIEARKVQIGAVDVVEGKPLGYAGGASHLGLNAGFAVHLEDWNLDETSQVEALRKLMEGQDPFLLTGCPRCDPHTILPKLNTTYLGGPETSEKGAHHLRRCVKFYTSRHEKNKYFLHEHPAHSDSWRDPEVRRLQALPGVFTVPGPMCAWETEQGHGLVYKRTKFVTNSLELAMVLSRHSSSRRGGPVRRRVVVERGLTNLCSNYPDELVNVVLEGIKRQMLYDETLDAVEMYSGGPTPTQPVFDHEWQEQVDEFFDDISGEALPADGVKKARMEEIAWVHKIKLYDKVPRKQALASGKGILPVRWVDVNKGDKQNMKLRSRLVGKELKAKTKEALLAHELFSATPPWEMIKALFSLLVTDQDGCKEELVMGVFDISRAHFMPMAQRELYIEIPKEDLDEGDGDVVGRLNRGMYGFRDASNAWMKDWQDLLASGGYGVGTANPALFINEEQHSRGAVHGDDFYVLGPSAAIDKVKELLGSKYQMRESHRLGFTTGCTRCATVLNRIVSLGETGGRRWVRIEPDKRHVELIVQAVGLTLQSSGVTTPSVKPTEVQAAALETSPQLGAQEATAYRSAVMRASFLSQERADISETVKRMAQGMSKPRVAHWELLKRLARYLIKFPNLCLVYHQQRKPDYIRICVDSDFAGDKVGRKSTTGMVQFLGQHMLKATSNLQSVLGLNVSEAEYYALTHGAAHGLGMQSYFADLGLELGIVLESDSSSARAFASRRGLGKQRHVQVRYLWLQQTVAMHRVVIRKIGTKHNASDILTKSSEASVISRHLQQMGLEAHVFSPEQKTVF